MAADHIAFEEESEIVLTTASGRHFAPLDERRPELTARLRELEASLAETRRDLRRATRRERDARSEAKWLHMTALEPLRQRVAELESRLEHSETARQRAESDLRLALESTSWRLTAPLRSVVDLLRRRRSPSLDDIGTETP